MENLYVSTFAAGLEGIVENVLYKSRLNIKNIKVYSGLIVYNFYGESNELTSLKFLNNTFQVISFFEGKNLSFHNMVKKSKYKGLYTLNRKKEKNFRVRFSNMNQFVSVKKQVSNVAELNIADSSKLSINRLKPTTEFWYVIRSENFGFFGKRLTNKKTVEKRTRRGELRSEFSNLLVLWCDIRKNDIILEPCAGYGSIPRQIINRIKFRKCIIADIDNDKVDNLRNEFGNNIKVDVLKLDVLNMECINSKSINKIVTDPPWGIYEKFEEEEIRSFYTQMLLEFNRVLKDDGEIVLVTSRSKVIKDAICDFKGFHQIMHIDFLLNGKKATIYRLYDKTSV